MARTKQTARIASGLGKIPYRGLQSEIIKNGGGPVSHTDVEVAYVAAIMDQRQRAAAANTADAADADAKRAQKIKRLERKAQRNERKLAKLHQAMAALQAEWDRRFPNEPDGWKAATA